VALDGLVVSTQSARALAIAEALTAEGVVRMSLDPLVERIVPLMAGRSLDEAVEVAIDVAIDAANDAAIDVNIETGVDVSAGGAGGSTRAADMDMAIDGTRRDLVLLRARRAFSAIVMRGLPLSDGAAEWLIARAASHGRVVLRADSARVDVERMLAFSGLADVVAAIRCADDPPRSAQQPAIERSWRAIADRLEAQQLDPRTCEAFECSEDGAAVARRYLDSVHTVAQLTFR
jgi:beta-phosphoglucomutase-like phosphatase (HAD superfamily)